MTDGIWFGVDGEGGTAGSDYRAYVGNPSGLETLLAAGSASGIPNEDNTSGIYRPLFPTNRFETIGVPGKAGWRARSTSPTASSPGSWMERHHRAAREYFELHQRRRDARLHGCVFVHRQPDERRLCAVRQCACGRLEFAAIANGNHQRAADERLGLHRRQCDIQRHARRIESVHLSMELERDEHCGRDEQFVFADERAVNERGELLGGGEQRGRVDQQHGRAVDGDTADPVRAADGIQWRREFSVFVHWHDWNSVRDSDLNKSDHLGDADERYGQREPGGFHGSELHAAQGLRYYRVLP